MKSWLPLSLNQNTHWSRWCRMTTWYPAILTAYWTDWFCFLLKCFMFQAGCWQHVSSTFLLLPFSYCLLVSSAFYQFQAIILKLSSISVSFFVRLGILRSSSALLESIYRFTFYHSNKFVPKPLKSKIICLLQWTLDEVWTILPASPIKMDSTVSGIKDVSAASGLPPS